jgi:hypothetical protein
LSIELKGIDPELHGKFRTFIKEERIYEPWRHTDTGKKLSTYERALEKGLAAGDEVPIQYENGAVAFENISNVIGGQL